MSNEIISHQSIWAFNSPGEDNVNFVYDSVMKGRSRFGWGHVKTADLRKLDPRPWSELNEDETLSFKKANFLLRIQPGDWIVHINVPKYGKCVAAKVTGEYEFDINTPTGDFRHAIPVDPASVIEFERNSPNVLPIVEQKLKLRSNYWQIYAKEEFLESLENLRNDRVSCLQGVSKQLFYLKQKLHSHLQEITTTIHETHLRKHLEDLVAQVFHCVPLVTNAEVNGSQRGTDYGADVIVEYKMGLPIPDLERYGTLVIQVKSFKNEHVQTDAVEQLEQAIEKYDATAGLLITSGEPTEQLNTAIDALRKKLADKKIDVGMIAGRDVARFMLRFGGEVLLRVD